MDKEEKYPPIPEGYRLMREDEKFDIDSALYACDHPDDDWDPCQDDHEINPTQWGYIVPIGDDNPILPTDPAARKKIPIYSGVIKYFPRALAAVAIRSQEGNDQHHPDKPLHWDRSKSGDEMDAMMRHIVDEDWPAVAWRALAHLEKHLEKGGGE